MAPKPVETRERTNGHEIFCKIVYIVPGIVYWVYTKVSVEGREKSGGQVENTKRQNETRAKTARETQNET